MADTVLSFEAESSVAGSKVFILASEIACIHDKDGVPQVIMKNGGGFIVVSNFDDLVGAWFKAVGAPEKSAEEAPPEVPGVPVPDWLRS